MDHRPRSGQRWSVKLNLTSAWVWLLDSTIGRLLFSLVLARSHVATQYTMRLFVENAIRPEYSTKITEKLNPFKEQG